MAYGLSLFEKIEDHKTTRIYSLGIDMFQDDGGHPVMCSVIASYEPSPFPPIMPDGGPEIIATYPPTSGWEALVALVEYADKNKLTPVAGYGDWIDRVRKRRKGAALRYTNNASPPLVLEVAALLYGPSGQWCTWVRRENDLAGWPLSDHRLPARSSLEHAEADLAKYAELVGYTEYREQN